MKRRNFLSVAGLLLIEGCSYGSPEFGYERFKFFLERFKDERENFLREHIKGILDNTVKIESRFEINGKERRLSGEALLTYPYLITVAHVTSEYYGNIYKSWIKFKGERINLESLVIDKKRDLAIFKFPKNYPESNYRVQLGDSRELELINEVYLIGNPKSMGTEIRRGIISREIGNKIGPSGKTSSGFSISIKGYHGDSGTPVINENAEVLGLLSQIYSGVSRIKPINWFKWHFEDS